LDFLHIFSKNVSISNFTEIRPVGCELFHEDGRSDEQIDMMTLILTFRNFANATKRCYGSSRPARMYSLIFTKAEIV